MHVISTAGHVDHGKSALVHRLTGIDPDRLEEEKRRGLTIDLGFAWLKLPSGREIGVVDVPGHERFIKNMLAGVGAINAALFVVAANEGWKPQSQEHLDILDLLGVGAAVIVITKSDTVDARALDMVVHDVGEKVRRTTLQGARILPVSTLTGEGIDELVAEIEIVLSATPPPQDLGRPRLWIDRVFTMRGSGTVVTGTLTGGPLTQNDELEILPDGLRARVRTVQSHKRRVDSIGPGSRTALNLTGVELDRLERGDVAAHPGTWRPTRRVQSIVRFLPHLEHDPTEKGAFKFYIGSAEREAEIRFLEEAPLHPGASVFASISLDAPVVADWQDRFVLRDAGRRETLGGGLILEPHPSYTRKRDPALISGLRARLDAADRRAYLSVLLEEEGMIPRKEIKLRAWPPDPSGDVPGILLPSVLLSERKLTDIETAITSLLSDHHREHPLDPGAGREAIRALLELDARTFDEILEALAVRGSVIVEEAFLRVPEHSPTTSGPDTERLLSELREGDVSPPTLRELETRYGRDLINAMVRTGELSQISPDLVFSREALQRVKELLLDHMNQRGPMTVAGFRDLVGTTRKYAVPLLEYFDQMGITLRRGDTRIVGPNARP